MSFLTQCFQNDTERLIFAVEWIAVENFSLGIFIRSFERRFYTPVFLFVEKFCLVRHQNWNPALLSVSLVTRYAWKITVRQNLKVNWLL